MYKNLFLVKIFVEFTIINTFAAQKNKIFNYAYYQCKGRGIYRESAEEI
jgi:hypothetical protein